MSVRPSRRLELCSGSHGIARIQCLGEGAQAILQEDKNLKQLREMIENESSSALELLNGLLKTGSSPFAENILGAQTRSVGLGSKQSMSRLGLPNLIELVERANSIDQRGRFTTTLDMFAEECKFSVLCFNGDYP